MGEANQDFEGSTHRHDDTADAAGSAEVRLPRLAARARDGLLDLGHCADNSLGRCCRISERFRRLGMFVWKPW